jgi:hypothetical protein
MGKLVYENKKSVGLMFLLILLFGLRSCESFQGREIVKEGNELIAKIENFKKRKRQVAETLFGNWQKRLGTGETHNITKKINQLRIIFQVKYGRHL